MLFVDSKTATFYNREGPVAEPFMFQGLYFSYLSKSPHQGSGSSSQRLQYMILVPKPTLLCNCFILGAFQDHPVGLGYVVRITTIF